MGVRAVASLLVLLTMGREPAWAALTCHVPTAFSLAVEQRQTLDAGGAGLVVVRAGVSSSSLQAGDVIQQANGRRMVSCADLEATAAEALAKGLVLLVAAERDGRVVAVALPEATPVAAVEAPTTAPPARNPPPALARDESDSTIPPASAPAPSPRSTTTPVVPREAALPPRGEASAELAAMAVAAAAVLGTVDEAARFAVPLTVYERRLDDAKQAIAALRIEGDGSLAVRSVVEEVFGYHDAARDIRRYKATQLTHARVDQRGAVAISLPYFSDSDVPRWVERYPFLSESLQQAPRSTHLLLPGEMAGRWNPDQAVELLWERAGETAARLGAWAAGR